MQAATIPVATIRDNPTLNQIPTTKNPMNKVCKLLIAALTVTSVSSLSADTTKVLYDFSSDGSGGNVFTDDFSTNYTGTPIQPQATGGINNGGALNLNTGDGTQAWFSKSYYTPLSVGNTLQLSVYWKYSADASGFASSIKMGLSSDPQAQANGVGMPTTGSWLYLGNWSRGHGDLGSELYSSQGDVAATNQNGTTLQNGQWYEDSLTITKVGTTSIYDFAATIM